MTKQVMPEIDDSEVIIGKDVITIGKTRIPITKSGDYVLLWEEEGKGKKVFGEIEKVKLDTQLLLVTYEDGRHDEDTRITSKFPLKHLLMNMGPDPIEGSVHGTKIVLWRGSKETPAGTIHFFRQLDDTGKQYILDSIKFVYKLYKNLRLDKVLFPMEFHVHKASGKHGGSYRYNEGKTKRGTEIPMLDVITYKPQEYDKNGCLYYATHEVAHALWARLMTPHEKARWVRAYHKSVQVEAIAKSTLNEVLNDFITAGSQYDPPNDEHAAIWADALEFIENKHYIDWEHLVNLLDGGQSELVKDMWPKFGDISTQTEGKLPTVYSAESPTELFCDTVFLAQTKQKLDENYQKLYDNTIKAILKRNS